MPIAERGGGGINGASVSEESSSFLSPYDHLLTSGRRTCTT